MPTDYEVMRRLAERDLLARDSHPASRTEAPAPSGPRRRAPHEALPLRELDPSREGDRLTRAGALAQLGMDPQVEGRGSILPARTQHGDWVAPEPIKALIESLAVMDQPHLFGAEDAANLVGGAAGATLPGARVAPGTVQSLFIGPRSRAYDLRSAELAESILRERGKKAPEKGLQAWDETRTFLAPDRTLLQEVPTDSLAWRIGDEAVPGKVGETNLIPLREAMSGLEPLVDAYPSINDIILRLTNKGEAGKYQWGAYEPELGDLPPLIDIFTQGQALPGHATGSIRHELGHHAQRREGMQSGAGSRMGALIRDMYKGDLERAETMLKNAVRHGPRWHELQRTIKQVTPLANLDAHSHYEAFLGEILARTQTKRGEMSPDLRAIQPPSESTNWVRSSPYTHLGMSDTLGPGLPVPHGLKGVGPVRSPRDRRDSAGIAQSNPFAPPDPLTDDLQAVLAALRAAESGR